MKDESLSVKGWKCGDWLWRPMSMTQWFCESVCPFGRNGYDTKFFNCKKEREALLKSIILLEGDK